MVFKPSAFGAAMRLQIKKINKNTAVETCIKNDFVTYAKNAGSYVTSFNFRSKMDRSKYRSS